MQNTGKLPKTDWAEFLRMNLAVMKTLSDNDIRGLCCELDSASSNERSNAAFQLSGLGPAVVPYLVEAYGKLRRWQGRVVCIFDLIKYARTHEDAFRVGLAALEDRATLVRYRACMLLAFAQRPEAIEHLKKLTTHRDKKTAEDAAAAIDAVENQNPNYFVDRSHTGQMFWSVAGYPESLQPLQRILEDRPKPWWMFWSRRG